MSWPASTPDGIVEIVEKVGDVVHGTILTDAEGNKYVPQSQGYGVVPLEVAQAVAEVEDEPVEEETPADDGAPEGDVESGEGEAVGA